MLVKEAKALIESMGYEFREGMMSVPFFRPGSSELMGYVWWQDLPGFPLAYVECRTKQLATDLTLRGIPVKYVPSTEDQIKYD